MTYHIKLFLRFHVYNLFFIRIIPRSIGKKLTIYIAFRLHHSFCSNINSKHTNDRKSITKKPSRKALRFV